jgi:predicted naringenin-chalcone synthase
MDTFYYLGQPQKSWTDWLVPAASMLVSIVAVSISLWVANRQRELQERQLRKDLFDRRFDIYTKTRDFMTYTMRNDGMIVLTGPEYREFQDTMEKAEMLCEKAHPYLVEINKAALELFEYKQKEPESVSTGDVDAIQQGGRLRVRLFVSLPQRRKEAFRPYLNLEKRNRW